MESAGESVRKQSWLRKHWAKVAIGCALTFMAVIAGGFLLLMFLFRGIEDLGGGFCATNTPDRLKNIENLAQFQFPSSAVNIQTSCGGMQGWGASASFEMSPNDLATLQASTRVEQEEWVSNMPTSNASQGLQPPSQFIADLAEAYTSYLYGIYSVPEFQQEILIDTSSSEVYRVSVHVLGG